MADEYCGHGAPEAHCPVCRPRGMTDCFIKAAEVALQPGWLASQIEECRNEVDSWPESLKRMARGEPMQTELDALRAEITRLNQLTVEQAAEIGELRGKLFAQEGKYANLYFAVTAIVADPCAVDKRKLADIATVIMGCKAPREEILSEENAAEFMRIATTKPSTSLQEIIKHGKCDDYQCPCEACLMLLPSDGRSPPIHRRRMILCATCGNKRCPHAQDHRYVCTGSNAPNQVGKLKEPQ